MLPLLLVSEWIMTNPQSPMTNVIKVLFKESPIEALPFVILPKYLLNQNIARVLEAVYVGDIDFEFELEGCIDHGDNFLLDRNEGEQFCCLLEALGYEVVVESYESYYYSLCEVMELSEV